MYKLLSADFARLKKCKAFWLLAAAMFLWGGIVYLFLNSNIKNYGITNINYNLYFFHGMILMGGLEALLTGFFIGTEYADGTIRNKLFTGHARKDIYLTNLIVCTAAGILLYIAYLAAALPVGLLLIGPEIWTGLHAPVLGLCYGLLITVAYASMFTLLAMLDANKARSLVIGLLLALALVFVAFWLYNRLLQQEFTNRAVLNAAGQIELQEGVPNSLYLSGIKREVCEWLDTISPSSQAMHLIDNSGNYSVRMLFCSLGITTFSTACGIIIFKKKDIK